MWSRPVGGIRFGNCVFSEPVPLDRACLPVNSTGVYVILTPDPTWGPRHFQPLFFGEFAGGLHCSITTTELSLCYRAAAGKGLLISVLAMPGAHVGDVILLKRRLIQDYAPICNRNDDSAIAIEMARRLETLERMTSHQELVLKLALGALGQMAHPHPETKKRIVGFITGD